MSLLHKKPEDTWFLTRIVTASLFSIDVLLVFSMGLAVTKFSIPDCLSKGWVLIQDVFGKHYHR